MVVVAMTSGQACVAATRMLVPQERKDEVLEAVAGTYGARHGRSAQRPDGD